MITVGGEEGDEAIVCNPGSLFETVHTFLYFNVYVSVVFDYVPEIVLVDDLLRDPMKGYLHIFESRHGIVEKIILDIGGQKFCAAGGDYAVDDEFGVEEGGGRGARVSGVL